MMQTEQKRRRRKAGQRYTSMIVSVCVKEVNLFFWISKICFVKKYKAPLNTQGVYAGTIKTAHKKKPGQTNKT
jgi:hypothetical protein